MSIIHVVSVSGGKDSQATMLIAINRFGKDRCKFVFADTGNEDYSVYDHLQYLEEKLNIKILKLKANFSEQIAKKRMFIARDQRKGRKNGKKIRWTNKAKRRALSVLYPTGNSFLDLCLWKGRFPSRKAQFCTQELKIIPIVEYQMMLIDSGYKVISWQGVRRDESEKRKDAKKFEIVGGGLYIYRPIVEWTAQQTIDYCISNDIDVNRLYYQGFSRVGCMLCVNASKSEIANCANRMTNHIDRIEQWEKLVSAASKRNASSFFPNTTANSSDKSTIRKTIAWAKTSHGGRQNTLDFGYISCSSAYGLCE